MASFKMMSSSTSRNSDLSLSRRNSSSASSSPSIKSHSFKLNPHTDHHHFEFDSKPIDLDRNSVNGGRRKSVDDVWKEIISGEKKTIKEEEGEDVVMMTLEDFLAKATNGDSDEIDVKFPTRDQIQRIEGGSSRGKRGRVMMMEVMDKAQAQRHKRMIKNRESAARSRERKQAYQKELETLVKKLEEENQELLKEIEERSKERYKKLMEMLIPVDEKPKVSSSNSRSLSRSYSLEW